MRRAKRRPPQAQRQRSETWCAARRHQRDCNPASRLPRGDADRSSPTAQRSRIRRSLQPPPHRARRRQVPPIVRQALSVERQAWAAAACNTGVDCVGGRASARQRRQHGSRWLRSCIGLDRFGDRRVTRPCDASSHLDDASLASLRLARPCRVEGRARNTREPWRIARAPRGDWPVRD